MKIKITCRPRYNPWLKKYLNTKTFSKMLAFGILMNSMPINSFAGVLSNDGRYETFEGNSIAIENILEENKVDIEIEGDTLVNILNLNKIIRNDGWTYNIDERRGYINLSSSSTSWTELNFDTNKNVELDKEYTMFINITKNTLTRDDGNTNGNAVKFAISHDYPENNVFFIKPSQTGIIKHVFRPTESVSRKPYISVVPNVGNGEFEFKDFMVIEGNHIDKDISYFEGMKSVGELENNRIKISSVKNYFDEKRISKDKYIDGYINSIDGYGALKASTYSNVTDYIPVKAGIDYFFDYTYDSLSNKRGRAYCFYDVNKNLITPESDTLYSPLKTKHTFTPSEDGYIRIGYDKNCRNIRFYDNTIYSKEILLNEPLRGLPNGTKDRIIKKNGQWVIKRNCAEIVLDGREKWSLNSEWTNENFLCAYTSNSKRLPSSYILADKFISLKYNETLENGLVNKECLRYDASNNGSMYIFISKTKLESFNIDGLKKWLSENPVTVVYQLETPIYEPLNIDSTINTYLDTTHILTNSTIPANLKITVDRVANRAKEYSELAIENPTIENISLARMWTNKMRESILKDEFQDNIDTITEITDMILDRKTASANLDVYIKSENMLSMNLSTNSITFEDFSGVEDMIKENAVNISINSSLPYSLNVYLSTEIHNSDKSNIMNNDILSIKDNSELDYQTFSSTNNKITLKSNCNSGNDKQHDINLKLNGGIAHEKDVYKTTIKFEAEQQ